MITTPPTTASAAEPLWTIRMVHAWLAEYAPHGDETLAVCLASDIVYDYEQERRRLQTRIDGLEAENRELSRMVSLEFEQAMKAPRGYPNND